MGNTVASMVEPVTEGRSSNSLIRVEEVHKYYELGDNRVHALRGVSIEIERGEFVAVMGASGSGKSTFMNILGCLDQPSSGRYFLEGIDVSTLNKKQLAAIRNQKIGFVFQGFNLLARTTALENAELPAFYARVSQEERLRRAKVALTMVGLGDRMDHFPSQLSGGQQQRVAIARALAKRPEVLLCDEPTGALDVKTGITVLEAIEHVNQTLGTLTVVITHNAVIADMADRVIHLSDGHVVDIQENKSRRPVRSLAW